MTIDKTKEFIAALLLNKECGLKDHPDSLENFKNILAIIEEELKLREKIIKNLTRK